ncbi:MAG: ceramidase domain-containing protein [Burkholderiales bacterium]|nr:ceramidase domain-containing protein [Burkholderiales bacterium]
MTDYIDVYCERVGPGLWAEPANALTNAAFFIVAWALWRTARRAGPLGPALRVLLSLVVAIGIGSSLFHTFATARARVLDELPIVLFQLLFVWLYARRVMGLAPFAAGAILAAFLVVALYGRQFPHLLNGSLVYAPALGLLGALGVYHFAMHKTARAHLALAAGVFALAVAVRTLDASVCDRFTLGTHFLWHLLVATVIYLSVSALLAVLRKQGDAAG